MLITAGILFFLRDMLFALSLFLISRGIFLFPVKIRKLPIVLFAVLLAGNAAGFMFFYNASPEDTRAAAGAFSFLLPIAAALSCTRRPRACVKALLLGGLLLDFTADVLYSLAAKLVNDAPVFEAAFGVLLFAGVCVGLRAAEKKDGFGILPGAFAKLPKPLFAVLLFFEFTCYYREFGEALSWYRVFYSVSVIAVIGCLFWMLYRILTFAKEETELLRQLTAQKEFSAALRTDDESLRQFRHDYKNHMIVVNAYMENGDLEAARAYLQRVQEGIHPALQRFSTGNLAADAILNYKCGTAQDNHASLRFSGYIPPDGIRDEDLCTVLSNLLDNAVEACGALPEKSVISVEGATKNGFFLLTVENPAPAPVDVSRTSKQDRKNHGFGLKNVKRIVKKYNGQSSFSQENGIFIVSVRLELTPAKDNASVDTPQ